MAKLSRYAMVLVLWGLLDGPPIVIWARTTPEHATSATLV